MPVTPVTRIGTLGKLGKDAWFEIAIRQQPVNLFAITPLQKWRNVEGTLLIFHGGSELP